jgi:hypothetical protein
MSRRQISYVHVYGSNIPYTSRAKRLLEEIGGDIHDLVYRFLGAMHRQKQLDAFLTETSQVGVEAVRAAQQEFESERKFLQRKERSRELKGGGPIFTIYFRRVWVERGFFGSRVIAIGEGFKEAYHKEGHTSDPPTGVPLLVQKFPKPLISSSESRDGYAHFCVRVLTVGEALAAQKKPPITFNCDGPIRGRFLEKLSRVERSNRRQGVAEA